MTTLKKLMDADGKLRTASEKSASDLFGYAHITLQRQSDNLVRKSTTRFHIEWLSRSGGHAEPILDLKYPTNRDI